MNAADLVKLLTMIGLIAIMLSMGFKVRFEEVLASIRQPRLVLLGLAANFALVPAVTIGLLLLLQPNHMVWVGFLILAVCPGAPVGPPFAALAKGDVAYATGLMVILAGLTTLLSPILLGLLFSWLLPASELQTNYAAIVTTLLVSQLLPLAVGLGIHRWFPTLTARVVRPTTIVANLLLLSVIILVLVREYDSLKTIMLRGWIGMLLLLAVSLVIGWLCAGPDLAFRKSLAVTTAVRNAAVALVIATNNFANTGAVTAVVAYSLVSIFVTLGCASLLGRDNALHR